MVRILRILCLLAANPVFAFDANGQPPPQKQQPAANDNRPEQKNAATADDRLFELLKEQRNAKLLQRHYVDVIMILKDMPLESRELFALDAITFDEKERIDLRPMAKANLRAGRIVELLAGGFPAPWAEDWWQHMSSKYGVTYVGFGHGSTTENLVREAVEKYNEVIYEHLRRKHPEFNREKEFDAFLKEWKKKHEDK